MCTLKQTITRQILFHIRKTIKCNLNNLMNGRRFSEVISNEPINNRSTFKEEFVPFDKIVTQRRNESKQSILVQVKGEESCNSLLAHCTKFGHVERMYFYSLNSNFNFVLIEMGSVETLNQLLCECEHLNINEVTPVRSKLLWFRADKSSINKESEIGTSICSKQEVLPASQEKMYTCARSAKTFSDQILMLYNQMRLTDLDIRLRFIAADQIETAISGMFGNSKVYPFGSSINSFGKVGSDLDLVLQLDSNFNHVPSKSRLIFHAKSSIALNRNQIQRQMEIFADMLQHFLPGCTQVKRILQARVPILRYKQDFVGLDCDLSMSNITAVHMSELLYLFGTFDCRVRPLVFAVRFWAKEVNLTNHAPGRWITNFSLTLLVLFYLQRVKIIPPLQLLVKYQRPEDERISEDGTNCSFLRDITLLPNLVGSNDSDFYGLLSDFFHFYASFDFDSNAISLNSGTAIPKPEYSAVYIVNPLEKHLNVTKNISPEECERLITEFRYAAWLIESCLQEPISNCQDWGLLQIIKPGHNKKLCSKINPSNSQNQRLMSVKELFNDDISSAEYNSQHHKVEPYTKKKPR